MSVPPSDAPQTLTDEQRAVVEHDPERHATVLAVAGSGKTTAMVHRVQHLIERCAVPPRAIRAVMFNRAARRDFERKLAALGVRGVRVQTFNALGHAIVGWAARQGLLEPLSLLEDGAELRMIEQALRLRRRQTNYQAPPIDSEDAQAAIRAWKGLLTPPDHARCTAEPALVEVYRVFEQLRRKARAMTFDDQIGEAVRLIEGSPLAQRTLCDRLDHLIIDEFQDVNHAQQRLALLIAGRRARVMVVGDDDQCIYEWRGARSAYIKRVFRETFTHHPHDRYQLTRSFRFGPTIARSAANAIAVNSERVAKPLVAADPLRHARIRLVSGTDAVADAIRGLPDDSLGDSVVLVRLFAQSHGLQARLIAREIPFFVVGERSLLGALPVRALRRYLWLADHVDAPIDSAAIDALEWIVDKPNRYVLKKGFSRVLHRALAGGATIGDLLRDGARLMASGITQRAAEALDDLADVLEEARGAARDAEGRAAEAAAVIRDAIDFEMWLGEWQTPEKVAAGAGMIDAFRALLAEKAVPLDAVDAFADGYDTRRGLPIERCLRITSIFRAKGLEWDRVILPDLSEGSCPHLRDDSPEVENILAPARALPRTEVIEAERRLFYVALTRARSEIIAEVPAAEHRSRFVDEGELEAVDRAVAVVQGVAQAGALSPSAADALRIAVASPGVHRALPALLDRIGERIPGAIPALERIRTLLDEVAPRTGPQTPRARRPLAKGAGLPF